MINSAAWRHVASVSGMRYAHVSTVIGVVLLAGCAAPGEVPAGSPETVQATAVGGAIEAVPPPVPVPSAVAVPVPPAPPRPGEASCARGARPMPSVDPSASFDVHDPRERSRRTLAQQHTPAPRRGDVPEAAVAGAEACISLLKMHFSLLTSGSRTVPDDRAIEAALRSAGLSRIVVRPGPEFTASTGAACLSGTYAATGPAFTIGPSAADGSCR